MSHVLSAVAWPYANGPRHIGHVAGFGVPSDVFSRYMRMAGHDVLMVSGHRRARHADPRRWPTRRGSAPRELVDKNNAVIAAGPHRPRPVLRPLHPHDDAQPLRRRAGDVHQATRNGYMVEQTTQRRDQPVDRAHAARPLHRGHLPDLRLRRGPRRPVRQLRQPARPDRPDRPAQQDQRRDAGVRRDPALLPRPAGARRRARRVARRARGVGHLAAQRHQVLQEPPRGRPPARDDPRHRLGHPGPARRLARPARPSGSTCGSTRSSATSRRPSSGRAAPGDPERWREWWNDPEALSVLLHGQGQHHLPLARSGPPSSSAYAGPRRRAAGSRGSTASSTCRPRSSSSEFMTMEGKQFSTSRGHVIFVRDMLARYGPDPLRYFICAAGPGEPGRRLHLGRLRAAQQLRARRRLGQPRQPHRHDDRQELRRDPGGRAARAGRRGRCSPRCAAGFDDRRRPARAAAAAGRASPRRCGVVGEVNAYVTRDRAVQAQGRRRSASGSARCCTSLAQCVTDLNTMLSPFLPHAANAVDARPRRRGRRSCRCRGSTSVDDLDGGAAHYPVITGDYSATPRWESRPVAVGTPIAKPAPVFRKFDPPGAVEVSPHRLLRRRRTSSGAPWLQPRPARTSGRQHPTRCPSPSSTTTCTSTSPARARRRSRLAEAIAAAAPSG